MDKGYLYLLIGALLTATRLLPGNIQLIPFIRLDFLGYILILSGIRGMRTSEKELKNAYYFAVATVLLNFALPWLTRLPMTNIYFFLALMVMSVFASIGIFFWLFKAEYIWSPKRETRMDWLIYSSVSFIYLVLYMVVIFPTMSFRILPPTIFRFIFEGIGFVNILRYAVLIYILVKLYLGARRSTPGFNRWG